MKFIHIINNILLHPLNKDKKFKAILSIIKWQIISRIYDGFVVFQWISNSKFIVKSGDYGITGNIYMKLEDFSEMSFLLHYLNKNELFVDVGANLGSYTILASKVKEAKSISIEPIMETFDRLRQNIAINDICDKVKLLNYGVGSKKQKLKFINNNGAMNKIVFDNSNQSSTESVNILTLDDILLNCKPVIIKIDTEGYEFEILKGAKNTLMKKSLKAIIIELGANNSVNYGNNYVMITKLLKTHNFKPIDYDPIKREIKKSRSVNKNTIFIRDSKLISNRLKNSKKIDLNDNQFI